MKKSHLILSALGMIFAASSLLANTCQIDANQMVNQINQRESIHSPGCPYSMGSYGYGITYVKNVMPGRGETCTATCIYGNGEDPHCQWIKGNWGNTLTCSW